MTAQLSRVVYRIGSPENEQHHFIDSKDYADIAKNNGYEVAEYVLAGLDSKPVYQLSESWNGQPFSGWKGCTKEEFEAAIPCGCERMHRVLYTAPPAPVAVADKWPEKLTWSHHDDMTQAEVLAWNNAIDACRAAMLKAGPVTGDTVPDGWKLVPVEPTAAMVKKMRYYCGGYDKNIKDGYKSMIAAAPTAPEQEV